jgi:hypothetical protein
MTRFGIFLDVKPVTKNPAICARITRLSAYVTARTYDRYRGVLQYPYPIV